MTDTTLQSTLEALYGLERRKDKLGLDGTRALLAELDHPERSFRAVHVAGTNGKGSTCALIERALRSAGHRTGLFTSPHLVDFRERIRVDGRWPDERGLTALLTRVSELPSAPGRTFFEIATALGFAWFAAEGVEWAVIEVGLGGRLDTTNVLLPEVCAITSIGLDHTEILGDTIEAIAAEKAGIVKPGVPVVLAPDITAPARETIRRIAAERGAPLVEPAGAPVAGAMALAGGFQSPNAAAARAVLEQLEARGVRVGAEAIARGFAAARWPGRFERAPHEPRLWWDGAHNPDGIAALARAWRERGLAAPAAIVLAVSRDKPAAELLSALHALAPAARLVATRSRNERALDETSLERGARAAGFAAERRPNVEAACRAALDAAAPGGLVLLTGSLFAIGEAMAAFGGAPGEQL